MAATDRAWVIALALVGCTQPVGDVALVEPDQGVFRDKVYPILLRDCAFAGCHGTHDRFFAVFGPGRARLDPTTPIYSPVTELELALTYTRTVSMIDPDREKSLLLRKPIPVGQGGAGHRGDDPWGLAVFHARDDARFVTISNWVMAP